MPKDDLKVSALIYGLLMSIVLLPSVGLCQTVDSLGVIEMPENSKYFGGHVGPFPKKIQSRDDIKRFKDWNWKAIGPHQLPEELNPGGKALPEYSNGQRKWNR
jgi:hypothetical protein